MLILKWLSSLLDPEDTPRSAMAAREAGTYVSKVDGSDDVVMDAYYSTMESLQRAISNLEYRRAADLALENLELIPLWVRRAKREFGSVPPTIPALEKGGTILVITGHRAGLDRMQQVVSQTPELSKWREQVKRHVYELDLVRQILRVVEDNPGCRQNKIKTLLGIPDARRAATLIQWLAKDGQIIRKKMSKTYELYPPSAADRVVNTATPVNESRRTDGPMEPRLLDLSRLERIPLPRAPHRLEDDTAGWPPPADGPDPFQLVEAPGWSLGEVESLPVSERPNPAFRQLHPSMRGIFFVADLGDAQDFPGAPAAAMHYDRSGDISARRPLLHDAYRVQVNAAGGVAVQSKTCVLHAYETSLEPLFQTNLRAAPEVSYAKHRFGTDDLKLKNHLRCVALSRANSAYLFTLVDMAWVIDVTTHTAKWGLQMPTKEGWEAVSRPASGAATDAEIQSALEVLQLDWPIEVRDIKKRYRELALKWHPDLNPADSSADERMRRLNAAVETLSGTDLSALDIPEARTFVSVESRQTVPLGGGLSLQFSIGTSEAFASDWIYAATFGRSSDSVYLGCYSGRVVEVDAHGEAKRFFDVGNVPIRIVDTGHHLYILTHTRLYIITGTKLERVMDVPARTELIVAENGFGLLGPKWLRWFSDVGVPRGCIVAKDPIRRVYWGEDSGVVETRQHRVRIRGMEAWWKGTSPGDGGTVSRYAETTPKVSHE
ncbi:DnaJ domain-containing protein [Candidatus Palauibacter sp.]|uniref:DnaJ domain-containing protein n=1 Tax=Candidatus Palauibacter sp. TaxID=3101350 RepID=UPI003B022395